jgi:hypothetical protein
MKQTLTTAPGLDNHPHPVRTPVVHDPVMFLESLCAHVMTQPLLQVVGTTVMWRES